MEPCGLNVPFALLKVAESRGLRQGQHDMRSVTYHCSPSAWPPPTRQVQRPKYRLSCKSQNNPPGWFHRELQGPCSAWCPHGGCSPHRADWCSGNAWLPGLKGRRQQGQPTPFPTGLLREVFKPTPVNGALLWRPRWLRHLPPPPPPVIPGVLLWWLRWEQEVGLMPGTSWV